MDLLKNIYTFVTSEMTTPGNFGGFHLAFILGVAFLTLILCRCCKDCREKTVDGISAFVWIVILVLEIYKQLIYGFSLEDGVFVWDYAWYAFPFQFCSSPLFILPIIAFTKNEGLRERCIAYMMTFSLFAGLAVFCYPNDVFVSTIGINLQTMIHHGSQILMGMFYAVRYRDRLNLRFFFGGVRVFVSMVIIAMILNVGVYHLFGAVGIDETFNMFYISPYFDCTLPLLSIVWDMVPYGVFVCIYFFGFILCALIVFGLMKAMTCRMKSYKPERILISQALEKTTV